MRCPDCCKFVSLDTDEPVVEELTIDHEKNEESATVRASVTISRTCAECSQELKSATIDAEEEIDIEKADDHEHDLEISEDSIDSTESGGGRYKKNMIGFSLEYTVTCSHEGCNLSITGTIEDAVPAGQFEETV